MKKSLIILLIVVILILNYYIISHLKRITIRRHKWNKRFIEHNTVKQMDSVEAIVKKTEEKNNVFFKIQMYIISLWLFFLLIIPITIQPLEKNIWCNDFKWYEMIFYWCKENILPIICLIMALFGYILFKQLEYKWKGTRNLSVRVIEVENENFEYLTFLTTYIIPLVCINLDELRYVIVLFILLVIIGIIFVKADFYLGNPTLALMGYKLYSIRYQLNGQEYEKMIVTKDKIRVDDYIESIPFDKNAWYVRRSR